MNEKEIDAFQDSVDRVFLCMKQAAIREIDFYEDTGAGRKAYHEALYYAFIEFLCLQLKGFHEEDVKTYLQSMADAALHTWKMRKENDSDLFL